MSQNFAPPPHDPADLDVIVEHRLRLAIAEGRPPNSVAGWKRKVRQDELENERVHQGWIEQTANGLRHADSGETKKLTGWRETRGTHGIDYVYDPAGTDLPPRDEPWDIDKAKTEYYERQKRLKASERTRGTAELRVVE